jgi:hypothetical protein
MNILRDPMIVLLLSLLLGWGVYDAAQPPNYDSADVSEDIFSVRVADKILTRLYPDQSPHVAGSPENAAMRDRVVAEFENVGYTPEIQSRFHCRSEAGRCSPVENIVAMWEGDSEDGAILLTAHYDSGWAGPGVADDGAGVAAILEIARKVSSQGSFSHDLIFLITDAEEQGLIGADAFIKHHPLFKQVKAVINLEARGVSGASVMFETGEGNRGIIRMLAKNLDKPVANSVAFEIYKRMPNDTDFSLYSDKKLVGVNFAFTGGASGYHSKIDDLNHLDRNTLQHHGQNAWSMLLALEERNLGRLRSTEDAVYIDLFGEILLQYPVSSSIGLALVLSVLVLLAITFVFKQKIAFGQIFWALLTVILLLILLPVSGWLLSWPLAHWAESPQLEHAFPWVGRAALFLAVLWVTVRTLKFLSYRAFTPSIMLACWGLFIVLALSLAFMLPAAGYLGALPLLGFALGLILDAFRWKKLPRLLFSSLFGFLMAAYLGFYFFYQLDVVLNFEQSMFKVIPMILPVIAVLPVLSWYFEGKSHQLSFDGTLLVLLMGACLAQQYLPAYTNDVPRDMAFMVKQEAGQDRALLVLESVLTKPDPDFAEQLGFKPTQIRASNGKQRLVLAKATGPVDVPSVVLVSQSTDAVEGSGSRKLQIVELSIPAELQQLTFTLPDHIKLQNVRINGQLAYNSVAVKGKSNLGQRVVINHPKSGRMKAEFEFSGQGPAELTMTSRYELPESLIREELKDWPANAMPAFLGHRILQVSRLNLDAIQAE